MEKRDVIFLPSIFDWRTCPQEMWERRIKNIAPGMRSSGKPRAAMLILGLLAGIETEKDLYCQDPDCRLQFKPGFIPDAADFQLGHRSQNWIPAVRDILVHKLDRAYLLEWYFIQHSGCNQRQARFEKKQQSLKESQVAQIIAAAQAAPNERGELTATVTALDIGVEAGVKPYTAMAVLRRNGIHAMSGSAVKLLAAKKRLQQQIEEFDPLVLKATAPIKMEDGCHIATSPTDQLTAALQCSEGSIRRSMRRQNIKPMKTLLAYKTADSVTISRKEWTKRVNEKHSAIDAAVRRATPIILNGVQEMAAISVAKISRQSNINTTAVRESLRRQNILLHAGATGFSENIRKVETKVCEMAAPRVRNRRLRATVITRYIAQCLNISPPTVRAVLKAHGITPVSKSEIAGIRARRGDFSWRRIKGNILAVQQ